MSKILSASISVEIDTLLKMQEMIDVFTPCNYLLLGNITSTKQW